MYPYALLASFGCVFDKSVTEKYMISFSNLTLSEMAKALKKAFVDVNIFFFDSTMRVIMLAKIPGIHIVGYNISPVINRETS
jgi:hypothetical protein